MRKILKTMFLALISIIIMTCGAVQAKAAWDGSAASGFASGTGAETNPYVIKSEAQLAYFANQILAGNTFEGYYISLQSDLDMTGGSWSTGSNVFSGVFLGNSHTITLNSRFLYNITADGKVDWLNLESTETLSSPLLCQVNAGTIQNCRVKGDVYNSAGNATLLCFNNSGTVLNSCGLGALEGYGDDSDCRVGWIGTNSGTIKNCYTVLSLSGSAPGKYNTLYMHGITATGTYTNSFTGSEVVPNDEDFVVLLNQSMDIPGYIWVMDEDNINNGYPVIDDCLLATTKLAVSSASMFSFHDSELTTGINCDVSGCTIYYTLDGTDPTTSSTRNTYRGDGTLLLSGDTVITTVAYKNGEYGVPSKQYAVQMLGSGTENDPYQVSTKLGLCAIYLEPDKVYELTTDLDFTDGGYVYGNLEVSEWTPIPSFSGTLNGKCHSIIGLRSADGGLVDNNEGTICELRMLDHHLTRTMNDYNDYYAHFGPVANTNSGLITRCYAEPEETCWVDVMYNGVGGIAGYNSGDIEYCSSSGTIKTSGAESYSRANMGGIAGQNKGTIRSCYSDASLYMCYTSHDLGATVGGITYGGYVYDCRFDGDIEINSYYASFGVGAAADQSGSSYSYRCYDGGATFKTTNSDCRLYYTVETNLYKTTGTGKDLLEQVFPAFDFDTVWMITPDGPMPQGIMQADGKYYTKLSYTAPGLTQEGETICSVNDSDQQVSFVLPSAGIVMGTCGDNLSWSLTADGVLTIAGTGEMYDYSNTSDTEKAPWIEYSDSIQDVSIGSGVTTIGNNAFNGCGKLQNVTLPESLTHIGSYSFANCVALNSIEIPNGVTSVDVGAFSCCSGLVSVTIPGGVTNISNLTFFSCSNLVSVVISEGVTYIGESAFQECENLSSLELPDSLTHIGTGAFNACHSLTSVTVPPYVARIEGLAFSYCNSLAAVYFEGDAPLVSAASAADATFDSDVVLYYAAGIDGWIDSDEYDSDTGKWNGYELEKWNNGTENVETYTVTYDANGGESAPEEQTKTAGVDMTITADIPTKTGYKFLGWAKTETAAEADYQSGDAYTVDEDITLYAVWERIVISDGGTVTLSSATAEPGEAVTLTASISNNMGIASFRFEIQADKEVFSVASTEGELNISAGDVCSNGTLQTDVTENGWEIMWQHTADVSTDGELFIIEFSVAEEAPDGEYTIDLVCVEDDIENTKEELVVLTVNDGVVTISSVMIGDITGDGKITNSDVIKLARYLIDLTTLTDQQLAAADVNGDGRVTNSDVIKLARYLVGLTTL